MHSVLQILKTTIVGGLFFLLPLVVVAYVVRSALGVASKITAPIADALPFPREIVGLAVVDILGLVAIAVLCFAAGLVARTDRGRRLGQAAEGAILKKVPGYSILRSMTSDGTLGPGVRLETALARVEDAWVLAFIVEQAEIDGLLTVFVPSSAELLRGRIEPKRPA